MKFPVFAFLNFPEVEMADGSKSMASLKPLGRKMKKKLKIAKTKRRGKGKGKVGSKRHI